MFLGVWASIALRAVRYGLRRVLAFSLSSFAADVFLLSHVESSLPGESGSGGGVACGDLLLKSRSCNFGVTSGSLVLLYALCCVSSIGWWLACCAWLWMTSARVVGHLFKSAVMGLFREGINSLSVDS